MRNNEVLIRRLQESGEKLMDLIIARSEIIVERTQEGGGSGELRTRYPSYVTAYSRR